MLCDDSHVVSAPIRIVSQVPTFVSCSSVDQTGHEHRELRTRRNVRGVKCLCPSHMLARVVICLLNLRDGFRFEVMVFDGYTPGDY